MTQARWKLPESWKGRWSALTPRERAGLTLASLAVLLAMTWQLLLAPALGTLRGAAEKHRQIDAQMQVMLRLQAEARALAQAPRPPRALSVPALEAATNQRLGGKARLVVAGDQATLTLQGVSPDALAQWLGQARTEARAVPSELQISRNAAGLFEGRIQLVLPP